MHPLDPLTADEVAAAARRALAAQGLSDRVRVVSVELREPD
jgi:Cu2+-containing amine oxidase